MSNIAAPCLLDAGLPTYEEATSGPYTNSTIAYVPKDSNYLCPTQVTITMPPDGPSTPILQHHHAQIMHHHAPNPEPEFGFCTKSVSSFLFGLVVLYVIGVSVA